jgi:hypothetical protein
LCYIYPPRIADYLAVMPRRNSHIVLCEVATPNEADAAFCVSSILFLKNDGDYAIHFSLDGYGPGAFIVAPGEVKAGMKVSVGRLHYKTLEGQSIFRALGPRA